MNGPALSDSQRWLAGFFCPHVTRLCAVMAVLVVCMPPHGLSIELCPSVRWTQAPCPGCGLTRCGAHLLRGHVGQAVNLNPFGLFFIPAIFALGSLAFIPAHRLERVSRRFAPVAAPARVLWYTLLGAFVIFGVVRWFSVIIGWEEFPARWF